MLQRVQVNVLTPVPSQVGEVVTTPAFHEWPRAAISWLVYEYPQEQVYFDVPFSVQVAAVAVVFVKECASLEYCAV